MPEHDPDVAMAEAVCLQPGGNSGLRRCDGTSAYSSEPSDHLHPRCVLAALTAAGYAVVKLPEGAVVGHGARLVDAGERTACITDGGFPPNQMCNERCRIKTVRLYAIEDTP